MKLVSKSSASAAVIKKEWQGFIHIVLLWNSSLPYLIILGRLELIIMICISEGPPFHNCSQDTHNLGPN